MIPGKNKVSILVLCLLLMAGTNIFAQNLDKKITLEAHNQPLGEVIKQISAKSGIMFAFNPQVIPVAKKITVVERNTSLSVIFEKVFTANGIEYVVTEKQVVLKLRKQETPAIPLVAPVVKKYAISGYVRDKASGEVIIGANVYDQASQQGTTTNAYGFYSLSLTEGEYALTGSYIGYSTALQHVEINKNTEANFELALLPVVMNMVEITADPAKTPPQANQKGDIRFTSAVFKQVPGFAGNTDVIKTLQNVPGIVTYGDGSSFYYVRGGNSDQNLLLIDEAPVYNPSHLFGFFSALAPDAIKEVRVFKGDFPAGYGGRLSSVVDVRAREGNLKRLGVAGNIGPYTSDLTLEGPIMKDKSSFLLSGRISNLNWLQVSTDPDRSYKFNFYDFNAKFNIWLNKNNRLFFTAFRGNDVFERYNKMNTNTFGIRWNNTTGTLRWNHVYGSRLFSNTTAYISRYNYFLDIAKELKNYWTSSISNLTLKTDFSWYANLRNTFKAGFEITGHRSNPGNIYYTDTEIQSKAPHVSEYRSSEFAIFAGNEQQIGKRFFARYGLRFSNWNDLGPGTVFFFDGNYNVIDTITVDKNRVFKSFWNLEPRINLKFAASENITLLANYNRNVQYLQVLSNSVSPFTSLDVWAPAGPNINPQLADQFSLGFTTSIFGRQLEFSAESFYKKLYNQVEYKDHPNMLFNPLLEGELRFGKGWSYGIETMLRKSKGIFTGWISYAYTRSTREIKDVNHGKSYPALHDRPHNFSVNLACTAGKHWSFSGHWVYLTGAPFSSPTSFYYLNGYSVPIYGEKNNDRFPDYHRLDVSATFALSNPGKRFQHNLVLTVYNAYGRHNPFEQNFNKIMDDNGNIVVPANLQGDVERIPTSISVSGAIPSLNYTFRF